MKVVCEGEVYDTDPGATWKVCDLDPIVRDNGLGRQTVTSQELRRTKASGGSRRSGNFFVLRAEGGEYWSRNRVRVIPVRREEAARFASERLDYDEYVEFFGDPRGNETGDEAGVGERVRSAEAERDFWHRRSDERDEEIRRLEAEIEAARRREKSQVEADAPDAGAFVEAAREI